MRDPILYRLRAWSWLFLLGCISHATCSCPLINAAERPPNVLVVITDDQGYGDIGFHGNREIQTPTLDALARSSLRFTNFHVDPTCAETRAALLTGQYPLRGGVWHTIMGRSILNSSSVILPQLFQQAGYRTGMFGKWHLGDNYPYRPQDRGFEQTLHLGGGGVSQLPDVWGNDYFDDVYWAKDQLQPVRGYCTDVFFNAASHFIRTKSDKPFFCYLATNAPHAPYKVPESYKKPYIDQGFAEPRASFYGMISNIDENLAKLLTELDQQGIADDTIVVFLTDNGSAAGYQPPRENQPAQGFNAGMRGLKGSPYEGGHRVPLFIRYGRKLPVDRDFPGLCAHIDLVPTLAELCGLELNRNRPLDGRSLVGYVNGKTPWSDRTLIVQSHRVEVPVQWEKSSVMTDRWRLIDGKELYDLQQDPGQTSPLPANQHTATIAELRQAYQKWWDDMAVDSKKYSRIVLGAPAAQRVRLTAHDWHGPQPPWAQSHIEQDPVTEGFWAVDVARPGAYQFLLARRPLEQPGPISATQARLQIAGQSFEVPVQPSAVLVPITVRLPAGPTNLMTQLISADGRKTSAYFVMVNYLGDVPQTLLDKQTERMPSWLQPGDRIAWLGGTFIERGADTGALEAETMLRAPLAGLTFANLGWSGDDFTGRARAVFGSIADGKARRLNDLRLSAASLVMIAYGMSELLDPQLDTAKLQTYEADLKELIAALKSEGRRSAICLPPPLVDDIEGSAAKPIYAATCEGYMRRRPQLVEMLQRVATAEQLPTLSLPAIKSSLFESGTYLSPAGFQRWASEAMDSLFESAKQPSVASRSQEQKLYQLARASNRLFFDMHRPQNETYLLLFRKHEQGNNAVELDQYRPLIAEAQHELIHAAARQ